MRRFFMGVLGWTPETVMRNATLDDLLDAASVYLDRGSGMPDKNFLAAMAARFPDEGG